MGGANHSPFETIAHFPGTVTAPRRGGLPQLFFFCGFPLIRPPTPLALRHARPAHPQAEGGTRPWPSQPGGPARARGGSRKKHWMPKQKSFWLPLRWPTCASRRPGPDE